MTKGAAKGGRKSAAKSPQPGRGSGGPRPGYEQVFEQIYRLVLRIPRGRVMTYGQIARLLDDRYSPRLVGWAMHATPQDERHIPWHRVVNSRGGISTGRVIPHEPDLQRLLLEAEGVAFNDKGVCDLSVYQWSPPRQGSGARGRGSGSQGAARNTVRQQQPRRGAGGKKSIEGQ